MKKVSIQFHATHVELLDMIGNWVDDHCLSLAIISLQPKFKIDAMQQFDRTKVEYKLGNQSKIIVAFGLDKPDFCFDTYSSFCVGNPNTLMLHLGAEDTNSLGESWLVTQLGLNEASAEKKWQIIARSLKRQTHVGAWAVNIETEARSFSRSHRYSIGAQNKQRDGVVLRQGGKIAYDVLCDD